MVTRQMSARQWYISIQLRNLDSGGDLVSKVGGHIRWRSQEVEVGGARLRAKPESRARSARELRAKPEI